MTKLPLKASRQMVLLFEFDFFIFSAEKQGEEAKEQSEHADEDEVKEDKIHVKLRFILVVQFLTALLTFLEI